MNQLKGYKNEGYQQGLTDALRKGGKIASKYTVSLFAYKTQNLSKEHSVEYISGWHDGYTDGLANIFNKLLQNESTTKNHFQGLNK